MQTLSQYSLNLDNLTADYCFVTAFKDIGREKWPTFKLANGNNHSYSRTNDTYLERFKNLCSMKIPLIVFVDYSVLYKVIDIVRTRGHNKFLKVISMSDGFLKNKIKSWQYIPVEDAIMKTPEYKENVKWRSTCPETQYAEYNCINHAKIDFVKHVIDNKYTEAQYVAWIDFGCCLDKSSLTSNLQFNLSKSVKNDKINVITISTITEKTKIQ